MQAEEDEKQPKPDALRNTLAAESARMAPEFDAALHNRVMRSIQDAARAGAWSRSAREGVVPGPSRMPWRSAMGTAAVAAMVAIAVWPWPAGKMKPAQLGHRPVAVGIAPVANSLAAASAPLQESWSDGIRDNVRKLGQDVKDFGGFLGERMTVLNVREEIETEKKTS
jgi:hypothetical protein